MSNAVTELVDKIPGPVENVEYKPREDIRVVKYADSKAPSRTKFTPERQKTFLQSVANHAPVKSAAERVNLNPNSIYQWLQRGEALEQILLHDVRELHPFEIEYVKFLRGFREARSSSEQELRETIIDHATGQDSDWRAAETLLKSIHRDKYSKNAGQNQSKKDSQNIEITLNIGDESPEEREIQDVEYEIMEEVGERAEKLIEEPDDEAE